MKVTTNKIATNRKTGKIRKKPSLTGKAGFPEPGHGRHLWKSDEDFQNFIAILNENSRR